MINFYYYLYNFEFVWYLQRRDIKVITASPKEHAIITLTDFTLLEIFSKAVQTYGNRRICGFIADEGYTYEQWGRIVLSLRRHLAAAGIQPGDRVALLGENSPQWGMAYFSILAAEALAVPILNDFNEKEIANILEHSGAKAMFVSSKYTGKASKFLENSEHPAFILEEIPFQEHIEGAEPESLDLAKELSSLPKASKDDIASIIYTSGTTGMSKGVMLSHGNIAVNAEINSRSFIELIPGDKMVSILPLSHSYEFTIGFIMAIIAGLDIHYLGKPPIASILLPALEKVKPQIMLSVPLLIEKVFRASVLPKIQKKALLRFLYKIPTMRRAIHRKSGKLLKQRFGGNLKFFGIGGAPLDPTVEQFLIEAGFPYAIGYGLTETAPLLAGCAPAWTRLSSTGKVLDNVEMRIADPHPETGEGEIQVRGPNVMKGYYRDPEKTAEVFTPDGWFKTGDLGIFDDDGYLYIKGREKNMILGSNGENIYPELIESVINNFDFVEESLVMPSAEGLAAQVKLDLEALAEHLKVSTEEVGSHAKEYLDSLVKRINKELNVYSRVQKLKLQMEPFIRTPTKKIKRYLYSEETSEDSKK